MADTKVGASAESVKRIVRAVDLGEPMIPMSAGLLEDARLPGDTKLMIAAMARQPDGAELTFDVIAELAMSTGRKHTLRMLSQAIEAGFVFSLQRRGVGSQWAAQLYLVTDSKPTADAGHIRKVAEGIMLVERACIKMPRSALRDLRQISRSALSGLPQISRSALSGLPLRATVRKEVGSKKEREDYACSGYASQGDGAIDVGKVEGKGRHPMKRGKGNPTFKLNERFEGLFDETDPDETRQLTDELLVRTFTEVTEGRIGENVLSAAGLMGIRRLISAVMFHTGCDLSRAGFAVVMWTHQLIGCDPKKYANSLGVVALRVCGMLAREEYDKLLMADEYEKVLQQHAVQGGDR